MVCEDFVGVGELGLVVRRLATGRMMVRGSWRGKIGQGGTDKIPSSGLSGISQLVVRGENEEDFGCHFEVIQLLCWRFSSISPKEAFLVSFTIDNYSIDLAGTRH